MIFSGFGSDDDIKGTFVAKPNQTGLGGDDDDAERARFWQTQPGVSRQSGSRPSGGEASGHAESADLSQYEQHLEAGISTQPPGMRPGERPGEDQPRRSMTDAQAARAYRQSAMAAGSDRRAQNTKLARRSGVGNSRPSAPDGSADKRTDR
jgi:hypothetical protein